VSLALASPSPIPIFRRLQIRQKLDRIGPGITMRSPWRFGDGQSGRHKFIRGCERGRSKIRTIC
jgi:hypothetical protein